MTKKYKRDANCIVNLGSQGLHPTLQLDTTQKNSAKVHRIQNVPEPQKHFLWTICGPDSSYSPLEIHICWKVLRDERMDPPIHTEYLRSGGATTLIFMVEGANAVSSFVMRSPIPANMVVPPDRTTLPYKSLRMSTSHFMMDWKVVSWMPLASLPTKLGWKRTSGHRKRSLPTVMMLPSGSSYVFSLPML